MLRVYVCCYIYDSVYRHGYCHGYCYDLVMVINIAMVERSILPDKSKRTHSVINTQVYNHVYMYSDASYT